MDNELIERLAREAGFTSRTGDVGGTSVELFGGARFNLCRLGALIAEECAKVAETCPVERYKQRADTAAAIRAKFSA